jgi:hypothetical protein
MSAMRFKIEHRIGVQRPVEQVWAAIYDLAAWKDWNPMYPEASGRLLISAPLTLTEKIGDATETYQAIVGDWVPHAQIVWVRKSHNGLLRHVRYLEIEKLSEEGCIFSNGEIYEGLLAGLLVSRRRRRETRQAFIGLGEAVKARTEAGHGEDIEAWRR